MRNLLFLCECVVCVGVHVCVCMCSCHIGQIHIVEIGNNLS